jgi:hypothetical protein
MQIDNKRQSFAIYEKGGFGNKLRTWDHVNDFVLGAGRNYAGTVSMRYKGTGGAWTAYNVKPGDVIDTAIKWVAEGADFNWIVVNESAPDDLLTIQGEIILWPDGLNFLWNTAKVKMRTAMQVGFEHNAVGLRALMMLKHYCSPSSYDDLMELFDLYPNSAIEFSVYKISLGDTRGRNTIVWECRNY